MKATPHVRATAAPTGFDRSCATPGRAKSVLFDWSEESLFATVRQHLNLKHWHRLSNFAQAVAGKEKVRKLIKMTNTSGVNLRDNLVAENELRRIVNETTKAIYPTCSWKLE